MNVTNQPVCFCTPAGVPRHNKISYSVYFCRQLLDSFSLTYLSSRNYDLACLLLGSAHENNPMYRNLLKAVLTAWLLGSFLLVSGCMLVLGGAGGYLIRKGEESGGGDTKRTSTSQSSKPAEQKTSAY